jgi:addiction module RelE/StbE family toxin
MAQITWTARATADLNEIAEYIALDNVPAAIGLVERIYSHVQILSSHPHAGSVPDELEGQEYRHLVEPPCRIFYKVQDGSIYILHVIRSERILRIKNLSDQE